MSRDSDMWNTGHDVGYRQGWELGLAKGAALEQHRRKSIVRDRYGTPERPDDIPESVWNSCWWAQAYGLQEAASRHIMAAKAEERAGCIADAEAERDENASGYGEVYIAERMIAAIRKRGESD